MLANSRNNGELWPNRGLVGWCFEARRSQRSGILLLFIITACSASARQNSTTDGLIKPPVIDKHDIRFTQLSINGESPHSRMQKIVQDDYGFLWFATTDGLYKYDGYSLKAYRYQRGNPNSVSDDTVMALSKDRDGSLWIGSRFGGLDRLDPSRDTFTHYRNKSGDPASLSSDFVNCIYQDRSGKLWIGTNGGLDRLEPGTSTFIHYRHNPQDSASLSGNNVTFVYEDRQSNLWVGTSDGLNKLDRASGRFRAFPARSGEPAQHWSQLRHFYS